MPQKKFRMFLSSKNTQTTAYHRFHAERQTNKNFQMNAGCCGNRNPLKGWRKEKTCCLNCCTRTQRVEGDWRGNTTPVIGDVFTQTTGTVVSATLLEFGSAYGIFELSDCNSMFVTNTSAPIKSNVGNSRLDAPSTEPPIDTYAPCQSGGKGTSNSLGYQIVMKNVQDCCKPSQLKMIQNRAASSPEQTARNNGKPYSVSGKIDRNYNYNYRQYLKKRCMIADYDNRSGGRQRAVREPSSSSQKVMEAGCCATTCCKCIHYATYQMSWATSGNVKDGETLYDAYGNSGVIQSGAGGKITTFLMDCVLFALDDNGAPFLYKEQGGGAVAKFGKLLSVRLGGCCDADPNSCKYSNILTYKRSNWGFRKQGAVDNGLYIANRKVFANPCCAGKLETNGDTNDPVTPNPPNPQNQTQPKKEEVEVPRLPVLAKEPGKVVENGKR